MKNKTVAILLAWLFWPAFDFYLNQSEGETRIYVG